MDALLTSCALVALAEMGDKTQLLAMLLDFLPEAAALGALLATGDPVGALLALIIGLQNLPEAFNAYRELRAARLGGGRWAVFGLLTLCAMLGPAAAALSHAYDLIRSCSTPRLPAAS